VSNTIAKIIVARGNDMLLYVIAMVSVKVQLRIGNKMLETIKASTKKHLIEAKVEHPSMKHVSNPKFNDTAIVFTDATRVLWIA
jgi:hypothetical protein